MLLISIFYLLFRSLFRAFEGCTLKSQIIAGYSAIFWILSSKFSDTFITYWLFFFFPYSHRWLNKRYILLRRLFFLLILWKHLSPGPFAWLLLLLLDFSYQILQGGQGHCKMTLFSSTDLEICVINFLSSSFREWPLYSFLLCAAN
jgi:hypothetical protein